MVTFKIGWTPTSNPRNIVEKEKTFKTFQEAVKWCHQNSDMIAHINSKSTDCDFVSRFFIMDALRFD